jgi:hypothetical protein
VLRLHSVNSESIKPEQIAKLKEATEVKLGKDYVLNHQYAAYLIRENLDLDDARFYLDRIGKFIFPISAAPVTQG